MVFKPNAETLAPLGADIGSYYSLGYRPPTPGDGQVHKIEVEVDRNKVRVRHRKRYIALTDRDRVAARALSALVIDDAENPLEIDWDVPTAGEVGDAIVTVPVYVRIPMRHLGLRPDGEAWRGTVRLFVVAQDLEGALAPMHEAAFPLKVPGSFDEQPVADFVVPGADRAGPRSARCGRHRTRREYGDRVLQIFRGLSRTERIRLARHTRRGLTQLSENTAKEPGLWGGTQLTARSRVCRRLDGVRPSRQGRFRGIMESRRNTLILGASYGSLLAAKLALAGHDVRLLPAGGGGSDQRRGSSCPSAGA